MPFENPELAGAVLAYIETQVTRGHALEDVLAEIGPESGSDAALAPLMERWIESFRRKVEVEKRQPRTLREYEKWTDDGGHIGFFWRDKTLADATSQAVEEWDYQLATVRKLGPKSRRNVMSGLRVFLTWVAEQRPGFAVPRIPWPEVEEHQPNIITDHMQTRVILAIPLAKQGIFWCMALTLVRPSEARVLRLRDWVGDEIRVTRAAKDDKTRGVIRGLKTRNTKKVPATEYPLLDWLEEHVTAERRLQDPDGPLFVNPDGEEGGWWGKTALRRTWAAACVKVGIEGVSLYEGLKHSTATHLKEMGADDRLLATLAGHRDPRSILKYARLSSTAVATGLRRLRERK